MRQPRRFFTALIVAAIWLPYPPAEAAAPGDGGATPAAKKGSVRQTLDGIPVLSEVPKTTQELSLRMQSEPGMTARQTVFS